MHRLFIVSALTHGCLSLVPQAYADTSAVPQTPPIDLDYLPFSWDTVRAIPRQEFSDSLSNTVRAGLDKAHADGGGDGIRRLTAPADIEVLRTLLKDPQCPVQAHGSNDTRFLRYDDGGKTQIFVDTEGVVSQESRS